MTCTVKAINERSKQIGESIICRSQKDISVYGVFSIKNTGDSTKIRITKPNKIKRIAILTQGNLEDKSQDTEITIDRKNFICYFYPNENILINDAIVDFFIICFINDEEVRFEKFIKDESKDDEEEDD